ncbi:MAG: hypothetical protein ACXVBX_09295 [Flavisolibacter sp.]
MRVPQLKTILRGGEIFLGYDEQCLFGAVKPHPVCSLGKSAVCRPSPHEEGYKDNAFFSL